MNVPARHWVVVRLGTAQTLAWASSYYLPALLAQPMARDLGVGTSTIFAAFSLALVVSALLGPLAGHAIDRHGGRPVLLGLSRKRMLGAVLGDAEQGRAPLSTAVMTVWGHLHGAQIHRVHDVAECARALRLIRAAEPFVR